MALNVIAEDSATFQRWLGDQLADGAAPTDSITHVGQELFVGGPCAMCHTVRGTSALAQVGPDLTHVASRLTIAAGTLPNTLGNLQAWIANAQSIKPGARMPTITQYNGEQLRALASYVASLR
jgi:cytochrome c oxidase subunit 2